MKKLLVVFSVAIMLSSCCMSQIPTQYYFATDSCTFYLPDYSQVVQIRDNCCVNDTSFVQVPNSGTLLVPGTEVTVTLYATDCYGNQSSMSFDVVIIDNVPPEFIYDSTDFTSLGQFQNDVRTWHFWTDVNAEPQPLDPPLYYSHPKTARDAANRTEAEIHDAYYTNERYHKMSLFMAKTTYRIVDMYMAIAKVGNPQGKLHVEIWQLNMHDTSLLQPVCGTQVDLNDIHHRNSSDPGDLPPQELIWQTVDVSDGVLVRGGWYAIRTFCNGTLDSDNKVIWNTTNYDIDNNDQYQFLKYSYDNEETYGINLTSSYMYQIWGIEIV